MRLTVCYSHVQVHVHVGACSECYTLYTTHIHVQSYKCMLTKDTLCIKTQYKNLYLKDETFCPRLMSKIAGPIVSFTFRFFVYYCINYT